MRVLVISCTLFHTSATPAVLVTGCFPKSSNPKLQPNTELITTPLLGYLSLSYALSLKRLLGPSSARWVWGSDNKLITLL